MPRAGIHGRSLLKRAGIAAAAVALASVMVSLDSVRQLAGDLIICRQAPRRSDAIVVLGGDFWGPRVLHAAALGVQQYAPVVLISGPPYRDRPESDLAMEFLQEKGYPRSLFSGFPHRAASTPDEITVLCGELHRRQFKNILLVTDSYHSRRSQITFRVLCPDIRLVSTPAQDPYYTSRQWWKRSADKDIVRREWIKIAGTIILAPWYWLTRNRIQTALSWHSADQKAEK